MSLQNYVALFFNIDKLKNVEIVMLCFNNLQSSISIVNEYSHIIQITCSGMPVAPRHVVASRLADRHYGHSKNKLFDLGMTLEGRIEVIIPTLRKSSVTVNRPSTFLEKPCMYNSPCRGVSRVICAREHGTESVPLGPLSPSIPTGASLW